MRASHRAEAESRVGQGEQRERVSGNSGQEGENEMEDKARERAKQPEVTEASAGCFSGWGHRDGEVVRDTGEGGRPS